MNQPPQSNLKKAKSKLFGIAGIAACLVISLQLFPHLQSLAQSDEGLGMDKMYEFVEPMVSHNPKQKEEHNNDGHKVDGRMDQWIPQGHLSWNDAIYFKHKVPQRFEWMANLTRKNLVTSKPVLSDPRSAS